MPSKALVLTMALGAAIVIAIIAFSVHASADDNTKELKLVHVVFRHGPRTPADTYPNDPYINETFYPIGWGQITIDGKLVLFNHGKWLRNRYDKFLGKHYAPEEFFVQTTDVDRTKVSAALICAGMWPPDQSQKWGPLDWQPIPVRSEPLNQDNLLLVRRPCAQYNLELDKVTASPEIQKKLKENEELFKELTKLTGKDVKTFEDVQDIYSTLTAERAFNLTIPDWTKEYYSKMAEPTAFSFVLNAYNTKLNRLKGGVFLKKLMKDWKSKADGTISPKQRKAFFYGGHDSTISNLLSTLKVWDPQIPGYAITILLELSQDTITKEYGLEVFLKNSTDTAVPPFQLTIPGCTKFCPLTKLTELTKEVIPENWEEECKSDDPNYVPPPPGGP